MSRWDETSGAELLALAKSNPPSSGMLAGDIYEFVQRLTPDKAARLPKLRVRAPSVHYWDIGGKTVYFGVAGDTFRVLHYRLLGNRPRTLAGQYNGLVARPIGNVSRIVSPSASPITTRADCQ